MLQVEDGNGDPRTDGRPKRRAGEDASHFIINILYGSVETTDQVSNQDMVRVHKKGCRENVNGEQGRKKVEKQVRGRLQRR